MKQYSILVLLLLCLNAAYAQDNFLTMTFKEALQKATAEQKLVFAQLWSAECKQCNDVAVEGIRKSGVTGDWEKDFVFVKLLPGSADHNSFTSRYHLSFGSLFFDAQGNVIHQIRSSSTQGEFYQNETKKALSKKAAGTAVVQLEKRYNAGDRSLSFLQTYLLQKKTLFQPTDTLLEEYVNMLPQDSLQSLSILKFIAGMEPPLYSEASKKLRANRDLFNQAWYQLPLQERININQTIIAKTKAQAVRTRNHTMARSTASFAATVMDTPEQGARAYNNTLLDYYKAIKDTLSWITTAIPFFEQQYMAKPAAAWRAQDSLIREQAFKKATTDTTTGYGGVTFRRTAVISTASSGAASHLINAATQLYRFAKDDAQKQRALRWGLQATDISDMPPTLKDYAILLYQNGQKEEAVQWMFKAIAKAKEVKMPVKPFEEIMEQMKNGKPVSNN